MTMIAPRVSDARGVEFWGFPFETGMTLTTLRTVVFQYCTSVDYRVLLPPLYRLRNGCGHDTNQSAILFLFLVLPLSLPVGSAWDTSIIPKKDKLCTIACYT